MSGGLHADLELRLELLAERIAALRRKMAKATSFERINELGEIARLERRYGRLAERLQELNQAGPGVLPQLKVKLETMADDLSGTVEDFLMWIDADFNGPRPTVGGGGE